MSWRSENIFRRPLSVRNGEPYLSTIIIGELNLPKKLDPLIAHFENL